MARAISRRHGRQAQLVHPVLGQGQTDQATAVRGHEIDYFRGDFFRGADQIAFVFAVLVINHDDHASVANIGRGCFDGGKRHIVLSLWPKKS